VIVLAEPSLTADVRVNTSATGGHWHSLLRVWFSDSILMNCHNLAAKRSSGVY
jgi:hypothetical protein